MLKLSVLALLMLMFNSRFLQAQCLASCSSTCSNDLTLPLQTGKKGEFKVSAGWYYMAYRPFSDQELKDFSSLEASAYSMSAQHSLHLGVSYRFTSRWSAEASMPYNFSYDNREGHTHSGGEANIHEYGNIHGWGDATLLATYEWLPEKRWSLQTGAGLKAPTGQTEVLSPYGYYLPQHLQPGSGSWDPMLELQVKHQSGPWTMAAGMLLKIATTALEHNMGNYWSTSVSGGYEVLQRPDGICSSVLLTAALQEEVNAPMQMPAGHHGGSESQSGELEPFENSGYHRLLLSGGAVAALWKRVHVPMAFGIPVYQHRNGYQVPLTWKINTGINFIF